MVNKTQHIRREERFTIEQMIKAGDTNTHIAAVLERGLSTISMEINRNGGRHAYKARRAHLRAYLKQYWKKKGCNKVAMNRRTLRFVEEHLTKGWSPEAIAARLAHMPHYEYASAKSVRKFIRRRSGLERFLYRNRVHKKPGPKRRTDTYLHDPLRKSIETRPHEAETTYGHWEGDFIVSKHGTAVLLVLVEKNTKTVRMRLLPNRNNDLVNEAVVSLLEGYMVNSLTLDNDIAFRKWAQLEEMLGADIYFCHPYHSWEKGLVENVNKQIRAFIPKRTDLTLVSDEEIASIEAWLNHTPRQILSGATPYEMMIQNETGAVLSSLAVNLPELRIWG